MIQELIKIIGKEKAKQVLKLFTSENLGKLKKLELEAKQHKSKLDFAESLKPDKGVSKKAIKEAKSNFIGSIKVSEGLKLYLEVNK